MNKSINEWQEEIHQIAMDKGWWDDERTFGEIVALMHSELSEALESYRNGEPLYWVEDNGKPEGIAVELVDTIIRILDYLGAKELDTENILKLKVEYNKSREYRHGNKKI